MNIENLRKNKRIQNYDFKDLKNISDYEFN